MFSSTYALIFLLTVNSVITEPICPEGCKCKATGYCYDCEIGYFMQNGECKKCPANCRSCSSTNECLLCDTGYYYYSKNDIECRPCSSGCAHCSSSSNCSECNTGYFRSGFGCNKCASPCKVCTSDGYCVKCDDGFILNGNVCQKCPPNYFKSNSECLPCEDNCKSCLIINECVQCKDGFFGKTCNQKCSSGCVNNVCEQNSGYCTCKDNYVGKTCDQCKPLKFGEYCNLNCPEHCLTCNSDGVCRKCKRGYVGIKCNCSGGCLGDICDRNTGQCSQCKPFFQWPCFECVDGKWGVNCKNDCPGGCISCISGNNCTKCKDGYYGLGGKCLRCSENCLNISCNAESGVCNSECKQGFWGKFCTDECPSNCSNFTCKKENGICANFRCNKENETCSDFICTKENGTCSDSISTEENGTCCHDNVDIMDTSTSHEVGTVLFFVSPVFLILATITVVISAIKSHRNKQSHLSEKVLGESIPHAGIRNSKEIHSCKDVKQNQLDTERDENINSSVKIGGASNEPEPTVHFNVYVDVEEYASIERKQFHDINEDIIEEIQCVEDDDNNSEKEFLYVNTEEYFKRRVPVDQLRDFVSNKTDLEFIEEFMDLPPGLIKPFNDSQKAENIMKNRYKGVYPYDCKRVIVLDSKSDYINASYIDGYKRQKAYIASTGPAVKQMGADFGVFWNMVWQERVCKIVMLTNLTELGVKKCDKYWPDKNECCTYGDVNVTGQSEEIYPCFTVRIFSLERYEKRILYQMHFTAWPDKSTPRDVHTLVEFWEKVTRIPTFELGPTIVHCSAGVGRTGTFIALDILANEGVSENTVDIFACVRNLREDRVSLVQRVEQYRFLHVALVNLFESRTSVKALLANNSTV